MKTVKSSNKRIRQQNFEDHIHSWSNLPHKKYFHQAVLIRFRTCNKMTPFPCLTTQKSNSPRSVQSIHFSTPLRSILSPASTANTIVTLLSISTNVIKPTKSKVNVLRERKEQPQKQLREQANTLEKNEIIYGSLVSRMAESYQTISDK